VGDLCRWVVYKEAWWRRGGVGHSGWRRVSSLKLEFKITNDEAEYEAVLATLSLVCEMEAKFVELQSDFRVTVGHI
jgi:ribonuclease HI